jgi:hypothetical protein
VTFYPVNVPANADFATNTLLSASGGVNLWFTTNVPPSITNPNDVLLLTNKTTGTFTSTAGIVGPPSFVPGTTYYLGVQNTNTTAVTYSLQVDFHLITLPPLTNPPPTLTLIQTNIGTTNGFLLVWFAPSNELFRVQWTPNFPTNSWNMFTNIVSYHTNVNATNAEFEFFDDGSQTGGFGSSRFYRLLLWNVATELTNGLPTSNSVASGAVSFYQVNVPANADFSTNSLLSASGPVNFWFTTNVPPSITNPNDVLLLTNSTAGKFASAQGASGPPSFVPGTTYYLGVQNTNATAVTFAIQVDFHLVVAPPGTNTITVSLTTTNIGGTNNFLLTWIAPSNDLFQVQWTPNFPTNSWNTFSNIISYSSLTNGTNGFFKFLDDGSQTSGFGPSRFYRLILYNSSVVSGVIPLTNGVPLNFSTGAGLTNYFSFDITQTNAAVLFELYNLTGNGDLRVKQSSLPVTPLFISSANLSTNYEQIVIRTNSSRPNINAISWFLGVPNRDSTPISYTIRAVVPTNGLLISGLPLNLAGAPSGTNMSLVWGPTVKGEKYEVRTNGTLAANGWGVLTNFVIAGTSASFTDPILPSSPSTLFYQIVQVP